METSLFAFKKDQTKNLLSDLDIKTKQIADKEFVLNEKKEIAICPECEKEVTINNLGTVAHGSNIVFCDNPACFSTHISKKKL